MRNNDLPTAITIVAMLISLAIGLVIFDFLSKYVTLFAASSITVLVVALLIILIARRTRRS